MDPRDDLFSKRIVEPLRWHDDAISLIDAQTTLSCFGASNLSYSSVGTAFITLHSNEAAWQHFHSERLYDTRRVVLENFHLFQWFPLSPGKFHTDSARRARRRAESHYRRSTRGDYYTVAGKSLMIIDGGLGAVRLLPRNLNGVSYHFMTASSSGICHEGFPVLVPRELYGKVAERILDDGAAPVTITGEMRYIDQNDYGFFAHPLGYRREVPLLYLHADDIRPAEPPPLSVSYQVSVAASFVAKNEQGHESAFVTYATFSPGKRGDLERACDWIIQTYVHEKYRGEVITDFDEVKPRFNGVVFGLPDVMARSLNLVDAARCLQKIRVYGDTNISLFYVAGDYVGRDKASIEEIINNGGLNIGGDDNQAIVVKR